MEAIAMGSIRARGGLLFFDFRYQGMRCREQTLLDDTPANRQRLESFMEKIDREIKQGSFVYENYFPNSTRLSQFAKDKSTRQKSRSATSTDDPCFVDFANEWYLESEVTWKISYQKTVRSTIENHLEPVFGEKRVSHITKGDILKFRSALAKVQNGKKIGLSPSRINHIMTTLRMILNDAADRFQFSTPFVGIKPLKVPPTEVDPFTIEEINTILSGVRADFRNYYKIRFFSALRTGEIDGLQWKCVDFERRLIMVRETLVEGRIETPKTAGSIREVYMSDPVLEAMREQFTVTGHMDEFVFCNRAGEALDHRNVTKRIWYPTLKLLGIKPRRPYQTRHTTATLWLAAGENPEWIARQMGHTSTEMLFTVYSRYVPNLTRNDGSAFERLLASRISGGSNE
jgi:integrase